MLRASPRNPRAENPAVTVRIAIVSSRALMLALLAAWVRAQPRMEVVAQMRDLADIADLRTADLAIVDVRDSSVFGALNQLREKLPALRILLIAAASGDYVLQRGAAVATGIIHEEDGPEILGAALTAVAHGGVYHSAHVVRRRGILPLRALTPRELAVLELACSGKADDEAAKALGCTSSTAETHRRNLMRKLGTGDRAELLVLGIQLGVVVADKIPIGTRLKKTSSRRSHP